MTAGPSQRENDSSAGETLMKGLDHLGLSDPNAVEMLTSYLADLERWNSRLGLVNASGTELVIRHVLDSLAGLGTVRELLRASGGQHAADLGTGGGLPGVPLACFLPEVSFDLVERSERKCGFLRNVVVSARLRNATVVSSDSAALQGTYELVTFRAFTPLSDAVANRLGKLLAPGGAVCAYKARRSRIDSEIDSLSPAIRDRFDIEIVPVEVPFLDEERNLLILRNA